MSTVTCPISMAGGKPAECDPRCALRKHGTGPEPPCLLAAALLGAGRRTEAM